MDLRLSHSLSQTCLNFLSNSIQKLTASKAEFKPGWFQRLIH